MKGSSLILHPEDEQLLRYLDGELPARTSDEIRSHLEACWQCRSALEELQNVVTECVHYRKHVLQRHLPAPPAPWIDIYRQFDEIDATVEPVLFDRITQWLKSPFDTAGKRWALAAVALLVVLALAYRYRQAPSVQASELLRKAVVAAQAHPERPRRIQIRTQDRRLARPAILTQPAAVRDADTEALNSLQVMFVRANYNWEEPLSARAFQRWREQLPDKQDAVFKQESAYRIETRTDSGELRLATLTLKSPNLEPVRERLEFSNQTWVEITDITEGPPLPEPALSASKARSGATPGIPSRAASPGEPLSVPAPSASAGDELRVVAALHDAGADLGEPIEVLRAGGDIIVNGVGIAPQRQQEIRAALGSSAHVVFRFSDSSAPQVPQQRIAPADGSGSDIRQLQARIAEQLGGRTNLEQLAAQVLDASESMMSRAYALRRLAEQFPSQTELELSPGDRQLLLHLRDEHAGEMRKQAMDIERALQPVLTAVRPSPGSPALPKNPADSWQVATDGLFQSARRLDKLLAVMFGDTPSDISGDPVLSQLKASLAQLRANLDVYPRSNR
jgi:hypothetical protein